MEDNREHNKQPAQQAGRNETIDSPGSKVADYGNPTGGAADDGSEQQRSIPLKPDEAGDGRQTIGNP